MSENNGHIVLVDSGQGQAPPGVNVFSSKTWSIFLSIYSFAAFPLNGFVTIFSIQTHR